MKGYIVLYNNRDHPTTYLEVLKDQLKSAGLLVRQTVCPCIGVLTEIISIKITIDSRFAEGSTRMYQLTYYFANIALC